MSGVATAIVGTAVIGGVIQADSARKATNAQKRSANSAASLQHQQYLQQREDAEPWRQAGQNALSQIESGMSDFQRDFTAQDFQADPGYEFRMKEGQKALERSAAARGGQQSGGTMKALTRYSQGVASDEFGRARGRFNEDRDRRFNRLASIAGVGQTANQNLAAAGSSYAANAGQALTAAGNATAAGAIAQGNAANQALSTGMNSWMQMQMMNKG